MDRISLSVTVFELEDSLLYIQIMRTVGILLALRAY